ncbi:MAG: hypothetical protein H6R18_2309 [Proteobacteria bacterium]|nr:hypothetical protein [Pseudomonadota bacterium]
MLLHHQFVRTAKKYENNLAIADRSTGKRLTYKKALIGALILAKKLDAYRKGFIGILLPNSAGSILAVLGTLFSGRIPVMINYSTGAEPNCRFAQKKCDFSTIITSRAFCQKINCPHVDGMVYLEDVMASVSALDKAAALVKAMLPVDMILRRIHGGQEDDTLLILFTSGSEREPKAVQLSHRNISQNVDSVTECYHFVPEDIFLANLPFFHVFGQTANLWVPLCVGMTLVTYANPLDFKTVCEVVREEKVTLFAGTPTFFWGYLRNSKPGDFETCRIMLAGADKCPEALRQGFMEKHGKILLEGYGATETSPVIAVNTPENNRPGSVGKPIPGVTVRVENYETDENCPVGVTGKILVKGDNVMKGYFDDFEQTAQSIRHGWYDTGDMGYLDEDGFLWHVGRLKRFLKIGGEMVSLVKVENVLETFLMPDVECCVVEIPDALRGARIVAAVTQEIDEKDIQKKLAEKLTPIELPSRFVVIPEMPKSGSGKLDFRLITEMVRDMVRH